MLKCIGIVLVLLLESYACTIACAASGAAGYPDRPVRILLGNTIGGGGDVLARAVALKLTNKWGRSVVVDNRAGASGAIAMDMLANAVPDGYTLYVGGNQVTLATPLKTVAFDVRKAYAPIVQMTFQPYIFVITASLPVHTVKEFIGYAKSKPLSYGSSGVGTAAHLSTELFKSMAGIDMVHVPYKGNGQALTDLISGQVQMLFASTISGMPLVKAGKLRSLAVTSLQRMKSFPDMPTVSESGVPGFELTNAFGMYAPAGTPLPIITVINREVNQIMNTDEMKSKLAGDGTEPAPANTPADFKALSARQIDRWEKFLKASGMSAETLRGSP